MENSFLGWFVVVAATAVGAGVIGLFVWVTQWFYRQGVERPAWMDGLWNAIMRWSIIVTGIFALLLIASSVVWRVSTVLISWGLLIGAALSAAGVALFLCGLSLISVEQRHPWMKTPRGSPSFFVFALSFGCLLLVGGLAITVPENLERLAGITGAAFGVSAVLGLRWLIRRSSDIPVVYPPARAPHQTPRHGGAGDLRAPRRARQAAMTRRTRARNRARAF
ncbi:MAG TPA: hypothetical protein VF792_11395 [Ktedonobacterales bacterium]